jgi:drug/metabolite transporter (DMT)-like permease
MADFIGSRLAGKMGGEEVAAYTSAGALILATGVVLLGSSTDQPLLPVSGFALAFMAGAVAIFGLGRFFTLLARYPIAVIAPTSAVASTATPVLMGLALGGAVGPLQAVGLGSAVGAVAFGAGKGRSGSEGTIVASLLGLVAGGLMGVFLAATGHYAAYGFQPVAAAHFGAVIVQVVRRKFRYSGSAWKLLVVPVVCGGLYHLAGVLFQWAARNGELSVVSAVASMYPLVTVGAAALVLRQRLSSMQMVGLILFVTSMVALSAGP